MKLFPLVALVFFAGCGRAVPETPLVLRFPAAPPATKARWRASVVRWTVERVGADGSRGRDEGRGAFPAELPAKAVPVARVRVELWLAGPGRPEVAASTFVGEGPWPGPVALRLWDGRWGEN